MPRKDKFGELYPGEGFLKKYGDKHSLPRSWQSVSTTANDYDSKSEWLQWRLDTFLDDKRDALKHKAIYERRERDRADAKYRAAHAAAVKEAAKVARLSSPEHKEKVELERKRKAEAKAAREKTEAERLAEKAAEEAAKPLSSRALRAAKKGGARTRKHRKLGRLTRRRRL
jgi:hypothetical protein